ncbi:MAG: hypothetical protein CMB99_06665 [Flavobacteriaceae bacterium]|nr:hypothetical protein [Flavobacteriaceae bacterium]|tara:strand:- start:99924 stop:100808 length:885 start_codon:yes stop_codon:yes gene_type:complete
MTKIESVKSIYLFVLLVCLITGIQLFVEELTEIGLLGTQILFWLSCFNIIYVLVKNLITKSSFTPKDPKGQFYRFFFVGISMICLFSSFEFISAASFSTLSRIDIPIIILITAISLKQSKRKIYLSVLVLFVVAFILFESQEVDEDFLGYMLVIFGVFGNVLNTLLKKRMSTTESLEMIILVGSASALVWCSGWMAYKGVSPFTIKSIYVFEIVALSVMNLTLNYLLIHLFKRHSAEAVRFPYIIAAVLTMVLEMVIEQKFFSWILISTNLVLLSLIALLVWKRDQKVLQEEII